MTDLQAAYNAFIKHQDESSKAALWSAIYRFFHGQMENEDNASDAALDAMTAISTFNPAIGTLDKWLITVGANRRRRNKLSHFEIPVEESELEQLLFETTSNGPQLDLAAITDPQSRMLAEDILAGYSIGEAAERCGLSSAAAYKRLERLGKNISRECLIL